MGEINRKSDYPIDLEMLQDVYSILLERETEENQAPNPTEIYRVLTEQDDRYKKMTRLYVERALHFLERIGYVKPRRKRWHVSKEALEKELTEIGVPLKASYSNCKVYTVPVYIARNPYYARSPDLEQHAIESEIERSPLQTLLGLSA